MTFSTSSKLSAAQSELQACELHLASKERELANGRSAALREGLGARLKALVDCGWAWGELGKEGLRSLEGLPFDSTTGDTAHPKGPDTDSFVIKSSSESGISSISPSQSASQIDHDHHDTRPPIFTAFRSSEPLAPEFSTNTVRPISMATTNTVTTTGTLSGSGTSTPAHAALLAATASTLTYAPAVAVHIPPSATPSAVGVANGNQLDVVSHSEVHLPIPPPHALGGEYINIPLAEMVDVVNPSLEEVEQSRSISPSRSSPERQGKNSLKHLRNFHLMRKITEEGSVVEYNGEKEHSHKVEGDIHQPSDETLDVHVQSEEPVPQQEAEKEGSIEDEGHQNAIRDPERSSDEDRVPQKLEVVENPRFMTENQRKQAERNKEIPTEGGDREKTPFGSPRFTHSGIRTITNDKNTKASSSKTFFGSLKGFFGSKDKSESPAQSTVHSKSKSRGDSSDSESDSDDDSQLPTANKRRRKVLQSLLFRSPDKKSVSSGTKWDQGSLASWNGSGSGLGRSPVGGKFWTEESSKKTKGGKEGWATADAVMQAGVTTTAMGRTKAESVDRLELDGTGKLGTVKGRTRASSDVGTSPAGESPQSHGLQSTRRLKKNRTVTVASGSAVERTGSSGSELSGKPTKVLSRPRGPPVAPSAAIAKATWLNDFPGDRVPPSSVDRNKQKTHNDSRRSNSVDIGIASRRKERRESYVLIDHLELEKDFGVGDGEQSPGLLTLSSGEGQIVDLGLRRTRKRERGSEEVATDNSNSTVVRDVVSRSSSLTSPRKATATTALIVNEESSIVPNRRLSRDSSMRTKGGNEIGKMKRTDSLGQGSFGSAGSRTPTSSRPMASAPSIPKSSSGTVTSSTNKTTAVTAPAAASLMSIVEDVKRIREAGLMSASPSESGTMVEVVRAPPRTTKEDLEKFVGPKGARRAGVEDNVAGSALFQLQAPGSVFDRKSQTWMGNIGSKGSTSGTPSPSTSALGVGVQPRQMGAGQVIKTPLKSALKNTSRTPSPSPLVVTAPLPLVVSAASASKQMNGGTTPSRFGEVSLGIGGPGIVDADVGNEQESTYGSGEEEFFTDEGELDGDANGNVKVEEVPIPQIQTPRKRKSVRVSLKPTFSPSPPAIEYEEDKFEPHRSGHHFPKANISHTPEKHKKMSSYGEKWEDSSDEDEGYMNAKAALSRAARKDKEVSLTVSAH